MLTRASTRPSSATSETPLGQRGYGSRVTYGSAGVPPATGGATPARRRDDLGRSGVALLIAGLVLHAPVRGLAVELAHLRQLGGLRRRGHRHAQGAGRRRGRRRPDRQHPPGPGGHRAGRRRVRPLLRQVVAEVVASEAFKGLFHAGVQEMHASVVQGHRTGSLLVRVDDAQEPRQGRAGRRQPERGHAIPDQALAVRRRHLAEPVGRAVHARRRPRRLADPPLGAGRRGLLHRRRPAARGTGGGPSRSSARAWSRSAS